MTEPATTPDAPPAVAGRRSGWKLAGGALVLLGIWADLYTKDLMQGLLGMTTDQPHGSERQIDVIDGFFRFAGNWNPGVTFGLGAGLAQPILYFTVVACVGILCWLVFTRNRSRLLHVALSLILSGAIGNLYDRVRFKMVRDFIVVYWKDWQWPAFNVADSMIVVGVCSILWLELFGRPRAATPGASG